MKKINLLTLLTGIILFAITSCNEKGINNTTLLATDSLKTKIAYESKRKIGLDYFLKTNGYIQDFSKIETYILEWKAQVSVQDSLWKISTKSTNYNYWEDFKIFTIKPKNVTSSLIKFKYFTKGTRIKFNGTCTFHKSENGWVIDEMNLIPSNT